VSCQLLDPWPIVRQLDVPVLHDLRQADLIAGGQGAPITPLADWVMFRQPGTHRFVVNLGGICNYTELPAECRPQDIQGGDYGPCNLLIDGLVQKCFPDRQYDRNGEIAASGRRNDFVDRMLRTHETFLLTVEKFDRQRATLGREDITDDFIALLVRQAAGQLAPNDLIASAVEWVARRVADCVSGAPRPVEVVIAGGGTHNTFLVDRIRASMKPTDRLLRSDEAGIPSQGREPAAMAVLGALCQDRIAITLPQITGADRPGTAGLWAYP
jgi:1,6-anhydro-N-acetylmuramate kinase